MENVMRARKRTLLRALKRGVTLIEILIVLAIVGLIAGGVAVVAVPKFQDAQKKTAKNDMITMHPAAESYRADHPSEGCPTVEQLVAGKLISATSKSTDPWNGPYKIICNEDQSIQLVSFGPDQKENTADDIKVPDVAPAKN